MFVVYLFLVYYASSFIIVWGLLAAMRKIYNKEGVGVRWWPYAKLALIPFIGSVFAILIIFIDFRHHVVNEERRRRKAYLDNAAE